MAALAAVLFSVNGVLSKQAIATGISAGQFTELRNAGAMVVLGVFLVIVRPRTLRVTPRQLPFLAVYGVVAFAVVQFLYFMTITNLPVGIGTLLIFLAPLFTAIYLRAFRHVAIGGKLWLSIGCTLAGLALVSLAQPGTGMQGQPSDGPQLTLIGVLAGLACAISLVSYWLLGERGQQLRDPLSLSFWGFAFATVFWTIVVPWWTMPWHVFTEPAAPFVGGWTLPVWFIVAWDIVLGTVIPFPLILGALRRLGAQRVGIVSTSEPVIAAIVALALLGETLAPIQGVGAIIVLAGIILAETARRPSVEPAVGSPPD
jgi:drug/metabolite transporter (DMT)-like permease